MANLKTIKPLLLLVVLTILPEFSFSQFNFPSFPEPRIREADLNRINRKLDKAIDKKDYIDAAFYSKMKGYYESWIEHKNNGNTVLQDQYEDSIRNGVRNRGAQSKNNMKFKKKDFSFYFELSQCGIAQHAYYNNRYTNDKDVYEKFVESGPAMSLRLGHTLRTFDPFYNLQISLNICYVHFQLMTPFGNNIWRNYNVMSSAPGFGLNITRFLGNKNKSIDFDFNSSLIGGFIGNEYLTSGLTINLQPRVKFYYNNFNIGIAYDYNAMYPFEEYYPGPITTNAFYFSIGYEF